MTQKKNTSGIWIIGWVIAFVAIVYLVSPTGNGIFARTSTTTSSSQQVGGGCPMMKNTTTPWEWCGGGRTVTTPPTNNTVDITNTYETVNLGHNEVSLLPETVNLTAGKNYKLVITPSADGAWCMNNMTLPGLDSNIYPVKKWVPVTIVINNAKAGTYELVCGNMGMHQWTIVIQ
jgi:hypothetical protein